MFTRSVLCLAVLTLLSTTMAFAQSSGNFSATGSGAACVIDSNSGALSGGITVNSFTTNISTSNGNGVTLDIRPSLVTGLFTDTKISTSVPTATADVGIQVCVSVDGSPIDGSPSPVKPAPCVTYDQRFQQISSQLFSQLSACSLGTNGAVCTTSADCTVTPFTFCNNPTGGTGTGVCINPNPLCNFELILSTLSAHSFDFVVPVGIGKPHTIVTSWSTTGNPDNKNAISCVGPGVTTVTQTKVFNNSGSLSF
jgi:hypothetical protein